MVYVLDYLCFYFEDRLTFNLKPGNLLLLCGDCQGLKSKMIGKVCSFLSTVLLLICKNNEKSVLTMSKINFSLCTTLFVIGDVPDCI